MATPEELRAAHAGIAYALSVEPEPVTDPPRCAVCGEPLPSGCTCPTLFDGSE